ncbi:hypothetical protein JGU71_03130 [Antrihabitans sp. YC3-6]|uniref:Uncharacterized protein n=1 Tax=Antrihabitans stalagmiti TaxID=2799499 RepID=A0A934NMH2_9NOCA|nr:hypothetical protein [Antrihabitans stalagmiti]MBJ8337870.1 hypothetical protein [Antrihabitans stalagmiti]
MGAISAADFATNMLAAAASPDRVGVMVAQLIGDSFDTGSIRVGPAGLGTAQAVGVVGQVVASHCDDPDWDIEVLVPVAIHARVDAGIRVVAYDVDLAVRARIRLVLEPPCSVLIDLKELCADDVLSTIDPCGMPSRLIGWMRNITAVVDDYVVTFINELLQRDDIVAMRRIDVAELLDRAWESGAFVSGPLRPASGESDIPVAI